MVEYFDIVTPNGLLTGERVPRKTVHQNGLWHTCVHLWLYTLNQSPSVGDKPSVDIMLQRRAPNKDSWPFYVDISSAGHISAGENPLVALVREACEELGLYLDMSPALVQHGVISEKQLQHFQSNLFSSPFPGSSASSNDITPTPVAPIQASDQIIDHLVAQAQSLFDYFKQQIMALPLDSPLNPSTFPFVDIPIYLSSVVSPSFRTSEILHLASRQTSQRRVSETFLDKEIAWVFALGSSSFSSQQSVTVTPLVLSTDNHSPQFDCQPIVDSFSKHASTAVHPPQPRHHVIYPLDHEVCGIVWCNIDRFIHNQRQLLGCPNPTLSSLENTPSYIEKEVLSRSPQEVAHFLQQQQQSFSKTQSSPHSTAQEQQTVQHDEQHLFSLDSSDDVSWYVPLVSLELYTSAVFAPMITMWSRDVLK